MLGDYDLGEFKRKWEKMVEEFDLEENTWVRDMYQKRKMWATAHIRGHFFAGFRTTSRCEGLHSEFGKFVNFKNNLLEFVQQFFRCLNYMRYKEVEANFASAHGEPVLQTQLLPLEKSAADVYTREVFLLFRPMLERACTCRVVGCKQTSTSYIYTIQKYRKEGSEWHVSFCPSNLIFKCSCERLESLGIPCEHLVAVLVYLDIVIMPECVLLNRWKKTAKDSLGVANDKTSSYWDPELISQYVGVVEHCKRMATAAVECRRPEYIRSTIDMITSQTKLLEAVARGGETAFEPVDPITEGTLRDPAIVRTKGCGGTLTSGRSKGKQIMRKAPTCGLCGEEGHNRKTCHRYGQNGNLASVQVDSSAFVDEDEDVDEDCWYADVDTNVGY